MTSSEKWLIQNPTRSFSSPDWVSGIYWICSVQVTSRRKRHRGFSFFFRLSDGLCYCYDIRGLFDAIGIPFNVPDWRLFIDGACRNIKADPKVDPAGEAFRFIQNMLPKLSVAKVKAGVFVGPQVPWAAYQRMDCRMFLKLHFLHVHLEQFKDSMGDYSEEQGERFHQKIRSFEERYKTWWAIMFGISCATVTWLCTTDNPDEKFLCDNGVLFSPLKHTNVKIAVHHS